MSGLPKLNMAAVKDTDKKEKKDKTTAKEKLKKFSASMKRGLTPRGSLARNIEDIEKDYALKPSSSEETDSRLVGSLGPRDSSYGVSDTESDATGGAGGLNLEAASSTAASAAAFAQPPADYSSASQTAPPPADPEPLVASPPEKHEPLPQFEPAGEAARAAREEAATAAPEAAEQPALAEEEAPSKVASGGRAKWKEVLVAVGIFTLGIVAAEPAVDAWRRRSNKKQPPAPIDAVAAKKKGGWGFS